jgi:hypothetical protein
VKGRRTTPSGRGSRRAPNGGVVPAKTRAVRPAVAAPALIYEGRCHCGALEFSLETRVGPRRWQPRVCGCRFCRAHGAAVVSDPAGTVQFRYVLPDRLRRYRFGLRTADYILCRECGVYLGAVMLTGSGAVAAISIHALDELPRGVPPPVRVDYRDESAEQRRARRRQLWTPVFGPV